MRLYYASDIHGSEKLWRKFLNAATFYDVDVLVMGGDLTGKVLIPVVETRAGVWEADVSGRRRRAKGEAALTELERTIRLNGFYPLRCGPEQVRTLETDVAYRDRLFARLMRDELRRWLEIARDKLAGSAVRCYVMPGNDDEWEIDDVLEQAPPPVESCEGRCVSFDGIQMISSAWTNPTPWASPRELPEEDLLDRLEELVCSLKPGPAVFNLHCPPHDSGLDRAPELTDDLRVVREGGEPRMVAVGSLAVRTLIERHQPVLALHGHIHEARGSSRIGSTLCVNPGSAYAEGTLDGVVVEIEDGEVVGHQLVSG